MTAPRLQEVVARVVAWHNRHPLARRIDASQVHSIGEVRLPFVSRQAVAGASAPSAAAPTDPPADDALPSSMSSLGAALAERHARLHPAAAAADPAPPVSDADFANLAGADAAFEPGTPEADPEAPATPSIAAADDRPSGGDGAHDDTGDDEAALVIPLLDGDAGDEPDTDAAASAEGAADALAEPAAEPPADHAADAPAAASAPALADGAPDAAPEPAPHADADADAPHPTDVSAEPDAERDADAIYPPPHGAVPASALARAVERRAAARAPHGADDGSAAEPPARSPTGAAPDQATAQPPALPAAPPASRWQRLRAALRRLLTGRQPGLPPLHPAFSQDFAWPLKPARIARWAQRHGQLQPLAPADWPRRSIDTDRSRAAALRQAGHVHDLPLHVLTAAIGVGDRRIRVLVGADGSVLGPRAWDRSRAGTLAVLGAAGLVALGWHLRHLQATDPAADAAVLAALAASAAAPASAAEAAAAPASAASAADAGTPAEPDPAASATDEAGSAAGHATALASAASAAPPDAAASAPQADIRPALSPEEKYAARVEAARLRGEPPPPPPTLAETGGPVYALVGPTSAQREHAAGSLALMKAAATKMDGAAPAHGELLQSQGQWRAAWWPFASLVDAERARVLLAGRGLKAEVVEF